MAYFIYREPKFEEALKKLRNKGGKGLFAAKKVDEIVKRLTLQEGSLQQAGKLTKKGERRIRYCRKFTLCNGYRLITIQKENYLILSYVGNHDDCSRWLERNKGLKYDIFELEPKLLYSKSSSLTNNHTPKDFLEEESFIQEYEKALMEKLNDSSVQEIISSWFKG